MPSAEIVSALRAQFELLPAAQASSGEVTGSRQ
jgi:hypothetical protein